MIVLKLLAVLVTGVLGFLAMRHVMGEMQMAKARVKPQRSNRPMTRLRQDPRTGVYYPEN